MLAGVVLLGVILEATLGFDLVFYYPATYALAAWFFFVPLFPLFWYMCVLDYRSNWRVLDVIHPWSSRWGRLLIAYPFLSAGSAALVCLAPIGWIAAATWAFGDERQGVSARLIAVEEYRPGAQACDQYGEIRMLGVTDGICLEGYALRLPAEPDQSLRVDGRELPVGFLIQALDEI